MKGDSKKHTSRKTSLKTFLESRHETEPKSEEEKRRRREKEKRSNITRQNNKTVERQMELNDSPGIPNRGET